MLPILAVVLVDLLGLTIIIQLLPLYAAQFLPLLTLSRLGLNGSGNAMVFVIVGVIVVVVQGGLVGTWSRRWGDRAIAVAGLALLALGIGLAALTPAQPVPW